MAFERVAAEFYHLLMLEPDLRSIITQKSSSIRDFPHRNLENLVFFLLGLALQTFAFQMLICQILCLSKSIDIY